MDDYEAQATIDWAPVEAAEALRRIADALEALLPMVETLVYPLRTIDTEEPAGTEEQP